MEYLVTAAFGGLLLACGDKYESSLNIPADAWKSLEGIKFAIRAWHSKQNLAGYEWVHQTKTSAGGTHTSTVGYSLVQRLCDAVVFGRQTEQLLKVVDLLLTYGANANDGMIVKHIRDLLGCHHNIPSSSPVLSPSFLVKSSGVGDDQFQRKVAVAKLLLQHGARASHILKYLSDKQPLQRIIAVWVIEENYLEYRRRKGQLREIRRHQHVSSK